MDSGIGNLNRAKADLPHLVGEQPHLIRSQLRGIWKVAEEHKAQQLQLRAQLIRAIGSTNAISTSHTTLNYAYPLTKLLNAIEI